MRSLLVCVCALLTVAAAEYEQLDKVEPEPIVNDPKAMQAFVGCFLDKTVCNELTGVFEAVHVELLDTRCAKCSPKLKHSIRRFYEELPKLFPEKWVEYRQKFGEDRVDRLFTAIATA